MTDKKDTTSVTLLQEENAFLHKQLELWKSRALALEHQLLERKEPAKDLTSYYNACKEVQDRINGVMKVIKGHVQECTEMGSISFRIYLGEHSFYKERNTKFDEDLEREIKATYPCKYEFAHRKSSGSIVKDYNYVSVIDMTLLPPQ